MRRLTLERTGIILFCATLGIGGVLTVVPNCASIFGGAVKAMHTTYASDQGVEATLKSGIAAFEESITDNIYGKENYINLYGLTERVLGRHYLRESNSSQSVIKDNNGQLQFMCNYVDTTPYAEEIGALKEQLDEADIPLLYVQTPTKVIEEIGRAHV